MTLKKARQLQPGQTVQFWDGPRGWKEVRNYFDAIVLYVTERGGVKLQTDAGIEWRPYSQIEVTP